MQIAIVQFLIILNVYYLTEVNVSRIARFECSVVVLKAVSLTSKSAQGFNPGY